MASVQYEKEAKERGPKLGTERVEVSDSWDGSRFLVTRHCFESSPLGRFFKNKENRESFYKKNKGKSSALEKFLNEKLLEIFESDQIITNNRKILKSDLEIDIYIKNINLAIEVNGIFHYKKIFKRQDLSRTQYKDERKKMECQELGINFLVINTSEIKYMNMKTRNYIWDKVKLYVQNPQQYTYIKIEKLS